MTVPLCVALSLDSLVIFAHPKPRRNIFIKLDDFPVMQRRKKKSEKYAIWGLNSSVTCSYFDTPAPISTPLQESAILSNDIHCHNADTYETYKTYKMFCTFNQIFEDFE